MKKAKIKVEDHKTNEKMREKKHFLQYKLLSAFDRLFWLRSSPIVLDLVHKLTGAHLTHSVVGFMFCV